MKDDVIVLTMDCDEDVDGDYDTRVSACHWCSALSHPDSQYLYHGDRYCEVCADDLGITKGWMGRAHVEVPS